MGAEVVGIDNLVKQLRSVSNDSGELKVINKGAAEIPLPDAKSDAPRKSGKLAKSGRVSGTKTAGVIRFGSAKVPYAGPAHFGHFNRPQGGYIRATPYLYKAADENEPKIEDHYRDQITDLLNKKL